MNKYKIKCGDNIEVMRKMPDNSIDAIITDPPYALTPKKGAKGGFMGKLWDAEVPSVDFWREAWRVLKPGGHILSFGGTRTYHRMVVNIEDAGFEIRDQIMWLYGSGFPKSHNIGKAIDKLQGNEREVVGGVIQPRMNNDYGKVNHNERKLKELEITKGQSEFEGWGTALKPANEPICLARKPLSEKSVAENVLKWRTGGLNIDGCRVGTSDEDLQGMIRIKGTNIKGQSIVGAKGDYTPPMPNSEGRFPANIIFDETAAEMLDEQSGILIQSYATDKSTGGWSEGLVLNNTKKTKSYKGPNGGASRFFYQAKVSKKERNLGLDEFEEKENKITNYHDFTRLDGTYKAIPKMKNTHPTVKPINLMTYLCRLITPTGGVILDPFMGSGSTGIAALLEGFDFVGIDMTEDYVKIAEARIKNFEKYRDLLK